MFRSCNLYQWQINTVCNFQFWIEFSSAKPSSMHIAMPSAKPIAKPSSIPLVEPSANHSAKLSSMPSANPSSKHKTSYISSALNSYWQICVQIMWNIQLIPLYFLCKDKSVPCWYGIDNCMFDLCTRMNLFWKSKRPSPFCWKYTRGLNNQTTVSQRNIPKSQ